MGGGIGRDSEGGRNECNDVQNKVRMKWMQGRGHRGDEGEWGLEGRK